MYNIESDFDSYIYKELAEPVDKLSQLTESETQELILSHPRPALPTNLELLPLEHVTGVLR